MSQITGIILAAGLGTRMKTEKPKVLHRIGSRPMIASVVSNLKKAGIEKIIAVVGYKAEEIEALFYGKIDFVRQPELLGSGDALARAVEIFSDDKGGVLVTCGDTPLITGATYKKITERFSGGGSSCVLLTCAVNDPESYGRIVRGEQGEVLKIVEEKDATSEEKNISEINVGTYCFSKKELIENIKKIKINEKKKEFYLTDIVDILRSNGKKIVAESCHEEEAIGINSRVDLAMANKIEYKRKNVELMKSGVTIVDPDNTYIDDSALVGQDTIIFPNTVIEQDVKIGKGCRIGPFARLRPGTCLEEGVEIGNFVELCRSHVGSGTKVKHHTYLGDTIVGCNANIGAGTITANYDGKNKHRTEIEDEAFIGVGAILVAPVKIGKKARVGAGSVVTKNKNVPEGGIVVGVPAKPFLKRD